MGDRTSSGKMRAKCLYCPLFVGEVVGICDTRDPVVNLLGHAGKDGQLFQAGLN